MAYCRGGSDSDLYMYECQTGYAFHLTSFNGEQKHFIVKTATEAIYRLKRLVTQGYKIPAYAIEQLEREIAEEQVEKF